MPDPVVPTLNLAVLRGHLSRAPEEVALASGDLLVRYEVTVPRADERADTVPVVAVSPPAQCLMRVSMRRSWTRGSPGAGRPGRTTRAGSGTADRAAAGPGRSR